MTRLSSPAILAAIALAFTAPAFAGPAIAIPKAEQLCKAAANALTPAPKSVRVDKEATTANNTSFGMELRVTNSDGARGKLACVVDRVAATATIVGAPTAALTAAN